MRFRAYSALVAALLVVSGSVAVAPASAAVYSPICDTVNENPVPNLSHTKPVPGIVKSAVLCFYSKPINSDQATVQSHKISYPVRLAKLLNQSKITIGVRCMVYFPYHFVIIFKLASGRLVYVQPVNCGPLFSNASDKAFELSDAARARVNSLEALFLPTVP